jgi:DNA-binding SARP family transcriptional activator
MRAEHVIGPSPPNLPSSYLERPRLEPALRAILDHRLTCVVADAGFGKTTLLASFAARANCAWYTLTTGDASVPSLVRGLGTALEARVHAFPSRLAAVASGGVDAGAATRDRVNAVAGLMCDALRDQLTDLVVVLDDLHELPGDGPSAALIGAFGRQIPQSVHVVIASQSDPPFAIDRLRLAGGVHRIEGDDLALRPDEVAALLQLVAGSAATKFADEVHELSGGWPAAVQMVAQLVASAEPADRHGVLEGLRHRTDDARSVLVETVVSGAGAAARELIRKMAFIDRFTPALCTTLGVNVDEKGLGALAKRGLLAEHRSEGTWYSLNPVVADHARVRWADAADERRTTLAAASRWFEAHGHPSLALGTALEVGDDERLAALIRVYGPDLIAARDLRSVQDVADALKRDVDRDVAQVFGDAAMLRGRLDEALAWYERAGASATTVPAGLAWRAAQPFFGRGDLAAAADQLGRADLGGGDPTDEAMLLFWRGHASYVLGDVAAWRRDSASSLERARAADDDHVLAASHAACGLVAMVDNDAGAGYDHWRTALAHAERAGDVVWIARIRNFRATRRLIEDAYDDALADLGVVLELSEAAGLAEFRGQALWIRAGVLLAKGHLEEALIDARSAVEALEQVSSPVIGSALRRLGDVLWQQGSAHAARDAFERAVASSEAGGQVVSRALAHAELAVVLADDDSAQASVHIEQALAHDAEAPTAYVRFAAGAVALARGDDAEARRWASVARDDALAAGDRSTVAWALGLLGAASSDPAERREHLRAALGIWVEIGAPLEEARTQLELAKGLDGSEARAFAERAERVFRARGARRLALEAANLLRRLDQQTPAPLAIRTLGGFTVERDGVRVPLTAWQSRKARDLLKQLVANRGRPVPREVLIDRLWPGEDPSKTGNRLSVALSTVRSVLDPDKRSPPDRYVTADQAAVALASENVAVDVESFLRDASTGLDLLQRHPDDAVPVLRAAEAAYDGEFLEEDPYEEWAVGLREEARAAYVAVAWALAEEAALHGDDDAAARYALRILGRDPFDERAHLGLVTALDRAGRHGEARRAYRTYCARMAEIDVEAAPFPVQSGRRTVAS